MYLRTSHVEITHKSVSVLTYTVVGAEYIRANADIRLEDIQYLHTHLVYKIDDILQIYSYSTLNGDPVIVPVCKELM